MSRLTPENEAVAREILERWFDTPWSSDEWNRRQMARLAEIDGRRT